METPRLNISQTFSTSLNTDERAHEVKDSSEKQRNVIIGITVGSFLLLVSIVLLCLYCWKKRKANKLQNKNTPNDLAKQAAKTDKPPSPSHLATTFVYDNQALQASQDIDVELGRKKERRKEVIHQNGAIPPLVDKSPGGISYDVGIKLMTPWVPVYADPDSSDFHIMKKLVEDSIETLYINFNAFCGVALHNFRQGSVIADVGLKFSDDTVDPLRMLEKAVKSGKFAQLEVDHTFFEVQTHTDVQLNIAAAVHRPSLSRISNSLTRSQRMESGYYGSQYGSQNFDPEAFIDHLKVRETSQKSTMSIESNTSDFGTSHSVSPKSCSSTNISMYSNGDDERKREKRLLQGFMTWKLREKSTKSKQNPKMAIPHIALFNFSPQDQRELALQQNELVNVTKVDDKGWVKAINTDGKQGWIPQNFVAPFDPKQYATTKKTVESLLYLDGVIDSLDISPNVDNDEPSTQETLKKPCEEEEIKKTDHSTPGSVDGCSISGLFFTIFPNSPTEKNELALEVGDLVDVLKTSETGWWKGCSLRTQEVGWFPSSYVRPQTVDLDINQYLEDGNAVDKGTVSDSEIHLRSQSFHKQRKYKQVQDGYSSDDGISRSRTNTADCKKQNILSDREEFHNEQVSSVSEESYEIKRVSSLKSRKDEISHHRVSFTDSSEIVEKVDIEPPCKPVPPKPRKSHLKHTYQNLILSGKLGSTESLKTRSTECLASFSCVKRSAQERRNSEEISTEGLYNGRAKPKSIDRTRPRSFQENPKSSFIYLANRYASSMKTAWSFPTLIGDQLSLSPDDERPYLVPIPRKSHKKNSQGQLLKGNTRILSLNKDSLDTHNDTIPMYNGHNSTSRLSAAPIATHPVYVNIPTDSDMEKCSELHHIPVFRENTEAYRDAKKSEIKIIPMKPVIAPKPNFLIRSNEKPPTIGPKPPPAPKRVSSKNVTQKFMQDFAHYAENVSCIPTRSSDQHTRHPNRLCRNLNHFLFHDFGPINEESEQCINSAMAFNNPLLKHNHRRYHSEPQDVNYGLLANLNENCKTPQTSHVAEPTRSRTPSPSFIDRTVAVVDSLPVEVERRSEHVQTRVSSLTDGDSNDSNAQFLAVLSKKTLRKHDNQHELAITSRTSSMQSLNSLASSRSTASSKHEQLNLRKAVMDVYGQGPNDLSFKAGAILYELRPRNKNGYCYGLLEDSTQGFYPVTSVCAFQDS